jgi:hypothetical protein
VAKPRPMVKLGNYYVPEPRRMSMLNELPKAG